jgi:hypothetical protein
MTGLMGRSADLTLVTSAAAPVRVDVVGRLSNTPNGALSPAQLWVRRKRRQWVFGITIAAVLAAAQAYGWLFVFGVV